MEVSKPLMEVSEPLLEMTRHIGKAAMLIKLALRVSFISDFNSDLKRAEESLAKAIEYAEVNKEELSASLKRVDLLKAQDELRKVLSAIEAAAVTLDPLSHTFHRDRLLEKIASAMRDLNKPRTRG